MTDSIQIIEDHPLPTTVEEANEFQATNPTFSETESDPLHPDGLRGYQQVIAKNNEWRIFSLHIYGYDGTYAWNHQLGYGLVFHEDHEFRSLVSAFNDVFEVLGME